jgi:hypothetical protein
MEIEIQLEGQRIKAVRPMTRLELKAQYWDADAHVIVIVLENGTKLYPSMDYEGNGGGAMFGTTKQKQHFAV